MTRAEYPIPGDRDDPTTTWGDLTRRLDAFLMAWAGPSPPDIAVFLPEPSDPARRTTLVELIKLDLEKRWLGGFDPRTLEEYLRRFPELPEGEPPCDLIYEEFHLRRRAGDGIEPEDCYRRFPARKDELVRLLRTDAPFQTTSVAADVGKVKFEPGQRVDDFELLAKLGEGGFGQVFLALQRSMQRVVAVKISAGRSSEPQTLAQLDHPNVVRVYDQRRLPEHRAVLLYMQFIPGGTLRSVIEHVSNTEPADRDGRLYLAAIDRALGERGEQPPADSAVREMLAGMSWPEVVCWVGARLADALAYAHRRGVLHRDVKPANVLLTAEGIPKLVDFNVSFASELEGATARDFFGGSLAYMSPEQLEAFDPNHPRKADSLDGRGDLFSLGMVLWEMLTGSRPFVDGFLMELWPTSLDFLAARRRHGLGGEDLAGLPRGCPVGLKLALGQCLAADPDGRYATGTELARELELARRPEAERLLHPPAKSWRMSVTRRPLLCLVLAALLPNLLTAVFNLLYNSDEIVEGLTESARGAFWIIQGVVNGVVFPLGVGLFIWRARPVRRAVLSGQSSPGVRARAARLGHDIALISLGGWMVAGVVYPASLALLGGGLAASDIAHFAASLTLCGLMAVAYSFFAQTTLCVRAIYPRLLIGRTPAPGEPQYLGRLSRAAWLYLLLAAAVPMCAIMALVLIDSKSELALVGLSAGGLAALGLAFWACRTIQDDLAELQEMTR